MSQRKFAPITDAQVAGFRSPAPEVAGEDQAVIIRPQFHAAVENTERANLIRDVWGEAILHDPMKVSSILRTQDVIADETGKMLRSAINMGRALIELRETLSPEEFARGTRNGQRAFRGWSESNIAKLIKVADFYDRKDLKEAEVPQSYTILYEFTTLEDEQFQLAVTHGLFRPDVKRSQIQAFKRKAGSQKTIDQQGKQVSPFAAQIDGLEQRLLYLDGESNKVRRLRTELMEKEGEWRRSQTKAED